MARKGWSVKSLVRRLGPGLLTGAADDDPSGIATYSQAGAQFGFALCWTVFLTTPLMVAIQIVSARIGSVTGRGLTENLAKVIPAPAVIALVVLLVLANTINIAADLAAMGAALRLLVDGPSGLYAVVFGIVCLASEIFIPYHRYARYLKALTLVLFVYVVAAFSVEVPWASVAAATFVPTISWDRDYLLFLVAILGTTISPYLFYWQCSLEVEERALREQKSSGRKPEPPSRQFKRIEIDTWVGMALSNLIAFFIIVTAAATLHAHGVTEIGTAAQAAEALRPLAGPFAFLLFSLGIIGIGLLAVPVLAGSAAYAAAHVFGVKGSLELPARRARGFYLIVGIATAGGLVIALAPIDPIAMLFWSAVINGIVAAPLMIAMMVVVTNRHIMGKYAARPLLATAGWGAAVMMTVAVACLLVTSMGG
jgi:NRAMP (natural resistance-associated macrophage protein)-like metal ion transporter